MSGVNLTEITALARRQVVLERQLMKLLEEAKELQKELNRVSMEDLPLAMAEAGLKKLTLESGHVIEVKLDFNVGIPEPKREEAFAWLEARKFGGLIKTEVSISFGKGELPKAKKLLSALLKKDLPATLTRNVHWQTLKAWVREQTCAEKPLAIPPDLFGNQALNKAVIISPKSKP